MRAAVTASLLILALSSCAPVERPPAFATRDSAGITIVESPGAARESLPRWTVATSPEIEIGGEVDDPGHQLSRVVRAMRLRDGRIVLGDAESREVRFFDTDGDHLMSVGGPGEGPGEFARFIWGLELLPGDTIVVSDWPFGTLTRFDSQGGLIGTETIGPYLPGLVTRILSDGALLVDAYQRRSYGNEIESWMAFSDETRFRATGAIVRHERGAEAGDTLREIVGEEWFKVGELGENFAAMRLPFGVTTLVSPGREHMFVAETGSPEIEVWTYGGQLIRLVRFQVDLVAVTAADRRQVREEVVGGQPQNRAALERWLAAVPFPDSKPPIRSMIAEGDGHLWVGLATETGVISDPWVVLNPEGAPQARVELPAGYTPFEIGDDYVLGVWKDDLDVEYVRLYALNR